jgi:hypothetical protein
MPQFEWLAKIAALTPANLTIREQARLAENPLDLRYQAIFPRVPAPSVKISELSTVDFRPVGGRRDWNAQGREIVEKLGNLRDVEMVPINPTKHIDERRLQMLRERGQGIDELIRRGIMHDVNTWPTVLTDACERQLERDAFEAWATNQITVYDPKTDKTVTVSLGIDAARYVTEATAWSNGAVNAYDRLLFHLGEAQRLMGSVGVVRMRRATANEVVKDAPIGANNVRPTIANLQDRLSEEGFGAITIVLDERTYDEYTDGGSATTTKNYVPAHKVLFQPASGIVGQTHVAPVTRAYDYLSTGQIQQGAANGVVVLLTPKNEGKTLLIEAQENALSLPTEQSTYVVDAGV